MSLKLQPSRPMPEDLARLGAILLPEDSPYRLIRDQLYAQRAFNLESGRW
jgi:hypothetical protein